MAETTTYLNYFYDSVAASSDYLSYFYNSLPGISWSSNNLFHNMEIDFIEKDESYEINVDLPGISNNDISVEINGGILTIIAERKPECSTNNTYHSKRNSGRFHRAVQLNKNTRQNDIETSYSNGVLHIMVKKYDDSPKRIPIKQDNSYIPPPRSSHDRTSHDRTSSSRTSSSRIQSTSVVQTPQPAQYSQSEPNYEAYKPKSDSRKQRHIIATDY